MTVGVVLKERNGYEEDEEKEGEEWDSGEGEEGRVGRDEACVGEEEERIGRDRINRGGRCFCCGGGKGRRSK